MTELYRFYKPTNELRGLPMIAMLSGFSDAGSTISQVSEHLFANLKNELVIRFDNDQLLDYRSRRPILYFEKDHIESYEPATLGIYLMKDEAEQPFLLLDGYEPDFAWEAFSQAITDIAADLEISSFTWVHSIPFPVPHTRPTGVTVSGNRRDLIERFTEWKPQTQVPGNVIHLLEFRLSKLEFPSAGFVMLVPHYLADNEVPQSAITGIELITAATQLVFPTDDLREKARKFIAKVNQQVEDNPDLAKLVASLEQGYASGEAGPSKAPIGRPHAQAPSADQIAEELESYLATVRRNQEPEE
jgi:hypothetical protein